MLAIINIISPKTILNNRTRLFTTIMDDDQNNAKSNNLTQICNRNDANEQIYSIIHCTKSMNET